MSIEKVAIAKFYSVSESPIETIQNKLCKGRYPESQANTPIQAV